MDENENKYTPKSEVERGTSEAEKALHHAEATTDFERRKLTKLLEYVDENINEGLAERHSSEVEPFNANELLDEINTTLLAENSRDKSFEKFVELYVEVQYSLDEISKRNPDEITDVRDVFQYNQSQRLLPQAKKLCINNIGGFFEEEGKRSADNIASQYGELYRALTQDEELNNQIEEMLPNAYGIEPFGNDYYGSDVDMNEVYRLQDKQKYISLLGGISQKLATDEIKELKPDKLMPIEDDISTMEHLTDSLDQGVWSVFEEVLSEETGFNAPEKFDRQTTQKWVKLKELPRFQKLMDAEKTESYETVIRDSLLKDIIDRKHPQTRFEALEPLRSFAALDVVLISAQDVTARNEESARYLLAAWSKQEGWSEFASEYLISRGLLEQDAAEEEFSFKDTFDVTIRTGNIRGKAITDIASQIASHIVYDENAPRFKKEYALNHMSDKDILAWGNENDLIEEVDFEEGKMIAMQLHGRMSDLVKQKYRKTSGRTRYHKYDRDINDINFKMDQLISYKKLILDNELDENNSMFLNDPKIVEKYVLNEDNYVEYKDKLVELVKEEGEFISEFGRGFSYLMQQKEGMLSLEDVRLLKTLRSTQSKEFLENAFEALRKSKTQVDFSEMITEEGYLKPEFFDAINVDDNDVFELYQGNKDGMDPFEAGTTKGKIPLDVWEAAFRARGVISDELLDQYMDMKPELKELFAKVRRESESEQYRDLMGPMYWERNRHAVAYLYEAGIKDFSFEEFRHIPSNRDVLALVNGEASFINIDTNLQNFIDMREKLGINIGNITVLDRNLAQTLQKEIEDPKKANFYRRMLAEGKGTFRSLVNSIDENNYSAQLEDEDFQAEVENAVKDLGNIAPRILKMYVESDNSGRVELKTKISEISKRIKKNEPLLEDIQSREDLQLLAEQISIVFPNNSYDEILNFINNHGLEDRTEDLSEFKIREDGYDAIVTEKRKVARLPENQTIDVERMTELVSIFDYENEDNEKRLGVALNKILTQGNAISYKEAKQYLGIILSTMEQHQVVDELRDGGFDYNNPSDVDTLLGKLSEATGIYFDDNIETGILSRIHDDDKTTAILQKRVINSEKSLLHIAKYIEDPADQLKYETAIAQLIADEHPERPGEPMPTVVKADRIATIIKHQLKTKVFENKNGLYSEIDKERSKFEFIEIDQEFSDTLPIKGYVSKNAASFFAKGTAGICTAGDVELYMRDDHFHINLFDGDTAIGNIQAYKIEHEGKQALLFRGFNPSTKYVNRENAPRMTEGMVSIVKQFAEENDIEDVFIAEQLGGWHALTNRSAEGVYDYFEERYLNPNYPGYEEVEKEVSIASNQSIRQMYRIPTK